MKRNILFLLGIAGLIFFAGIVTAQETTCSSCEDCSDKLNGDYPVVKLTGDIVSKSGSCIEFNADNVEFDCQGHTISGRASNSGIDVRNHHNVKIKNCIVTNFLYGIYLSSSSKNTLAFNKVRRNAFGIFLQSSNHNTFASNIASSNTYVGILIGLSSNYNTLTSNTASSNHIGISLHSSSNNTLIGNTASNNNYAGIVLDSSSNNNLMSNMMEKDGIYIRGSDVSHFNTHSIDATNTVNGRPVRYLKDISDMTVPRGAGQVILANVTNVTVENQNVSYVSFGIKIAFSSGCTIRHNTVSENKHGIYLLSSSNNSLRSNIVSDNEYGIFLLSSSNNSLRSNIVSSNENGIFLSSSSSNTLRSNIASDNRYGIHLHNLSNYNILTSNTVSNNSGSGIYIGSGIRLYNSNNNVLTNNNADYNQGFGIHITTHSTGNTLTHNRFCFNNQSGHRYQDILDDGSNSGYENTCNNAEAWDDAGTTGCTYPCVLQEGKVSKKSENKPTTTLISSSTIFAELSSSDKKQIQNQVALIANSVNNNDMDTILGILSKNARAGLKDEIETNLRGKTIKFQQSISSYEDLGDNKVKVKGRFATEGIGWSVRELSNYFIFERVNGRWLLLDTDFHQKMGADYVFEIVSNIFVIITPILILLGIFWLWMLIDLNSENVPPTLSTVSLPSINSSFRLISALY